MVYFQHGIVDNCQTWLVHGQGESMGFEAHDSGFDVYLGNYRGVYPRKITKQKEDSEKSDYWQYSIDQIARFDISAFIDRIFEIKVEEMR